MPVSNFTHGKAMPSHAILARAANIKSQANNCTIGP